MHLVKRGYLFLVNIDLGSDLALGLFKLLQFHVFSGRHMEEDHSSHLVALSADLAYSINGLLSGQQGVEGKAVILSIKRVVWYI